MLCGLLKVNVQAPQSSCRVTVEHHAALPPAAKLLSFRKLIVVPSTEGVKTSTRTAEFGVTWVSVMLTHSTCSIIVVLLAVPANVHRPTLKMLVLLNPVLVLNLLAVLNPVPFLR